MTHNDTAPENSELETEAASESAVTDETAAVAAPVARGWRSQLRQPRLIVAAGIVGVLAISGTILAVANSPTALARAADACSGSKPFDRLMTELEKDPDTSSETGSDEGADSAIGKYFDRVVRVEDGGKTLLVSTKPQDDDPLGLSSLALDCIYDELNIPTRVTEVIGSTRGLDGRVSDEWDNYSGSWTYHPDNGLQLIIAQR
ncbi:hypothetical protein [Salinibacterium sp. ZJ70]|uniref:hypothetical protein n=1 Tax=Salinibacterium sp. ZJ70 TaxID=2708084 RepID=UPI001423F3BD|nr:hypothetical protein [Salinibacterium sp. ZJ70]